MLFSRTWTPALLLALCLAPGCGSKSDPNSSAANQAVAARDAEMPVCSGTETAPSSSVSQAQYHLAEGATTRDRLYLALLKDDVQALPALLPAGADLHQTRARSSYRVDSDGLVTFAPDAPLAPGTAVVSAQDEPVSLLHWAATLGISGDTIAWLIAQGADVHSKDSKGRTPLMEAARNELLAPAGLAALLQAGADPNEQDSEQKDALVYAASINGHDHAVLCMMVPKLRALLRAGASIRENVTFPPVMLALSQRNLAMAKIMHALGADLRARATADGSSPLHVVANAADDSLETVIWLLSRGVDIHVLNNAHKTALELFKENLAANRCYVAHPTPPGSNPCAPGTQAIIKAIEHHHRK